MRILQADAQLVSHSVKTEPLLHVCYELRGIKSTIIIRAHIVNWTGETDAAAQICCACTVATCAFLVLRTMFIILKFVELIWRIGADTIYCFTRYTWPSVTIKCSSVILNSPAGTPVYLTRKTWPRSIIIGVAEAIRNFLAASFFWSLSLHLPANFLGTVTIVTFLLRSRRQDTWPRYKRGCRTYLRIDYRCNNTQYCSRFGRHLSNSLNYDCHENDNHSLCPLLVTYHRHCTWPPGGYKLKDNNGKRKWVAVKNNSAQVEHRDVTYFIDKFRKNCSGLARS